MPETELIKEVQVSELRKRYRSLFDEGKPLIVRKNSSVLGVLLCVKSHRWFRPEHPRKERSRLRAELEAVLKQILGR